MIGGEKDSLVEEIKYWEKMHLNHFFSTYN